MSVEPSGTPDGEVPDNVISLAEKLARQKARLVEEGKLKIAADKDEAPPPILAGKRFMSRRPDEIDEFLERIDIITAYNSFVVGKGTAKATGRGETKVRCPSLDHEDKNPSASINTDKQVWSCYSCSKGGDVYTLAAAALGMDHRTQFPELKREMARRLGHTPRAVSMGSHPSMGVAEPPAAEAEPKSAGPEPEDEDEFWKARPVLDHVRTFARARMASPWAVFGVVLARVSCAVPYTVVLPPIVGGEASLNTFVGIVGRSGSGKGAAEATAEDAVHVGGITLAGVGSGEGLAHQYRVRTKGGLEWVDTSHSRLFSVQEVDTLTALDQRRGATVMPELRKAWAGEALGFGYADPTKRLDMPRHSYRLALVVGIQPGRAEGILGDVDGGTPQRFLWMPATDPGAPDITPAAPAPWAWSLPTLPPPSPFSGLRVMEVCDEAKEFITTNRRMSLRGGTEAEDAHAVLCRLKVAAVLAVLDGRFDVNNEDWWLAGVVALKSRMTREEVSAAVAEKIATANRARGKAEGERAVIASAVIEKKSIARVSQRLVNYLEATGEWVSHSELRKRANSRDRPWVDAAMEAAVLTGQIEEEETEWRGAVGKKYRYKKEEG